MAWVVFNRRNKPPRSKRVWISFMQVGITTSQQQTAGKIVGKDEDKEPVWKDEITGKHINNRKFIVTHWMPLPDKPILVGEKNEKNEKSGLQIALTSIYII